MDTPKTLAARLRTIGASYGDVVGLIMAQHIETAADYLDRLSAPDVGVGLTRYERRDGAFVEDPEGEWIRFEDAALLFAAARAASRDVVAAYEEMSRRHLDAAARAAKTEAALAASTAREKAKDAEIAGLREALTKIAAFDDTAANAYFAQTGSYIAFDEPGAVILARAALSGRKPDKEGT